MLYWLMQHNPNLMEGLHDVATGDSRVFLTGRTAAAAVVSFLTAWLMGPIAIRWLKSRFRERIDSASTRLNELHAAKASTPTMGGLFIVSAILISSLLWCDLGNAYVQQAIVLTLGMAVIGGYDDWIKVSTNRRGLTARQKLVAQLVVAGGVSIWLWMVQSERPSGLEVALPITGWAIGLGLFFLPWAVLVIVGSSNGVNLTDGLDGLAGGCLLFSGAAFAALSYVAGHHGMAEYLSVPYMPGAGELSVVFGAMVGSLLGFLWYNCYPAEVFMGDTGSLPLGGLLGLGAMVTRQELLLLVIGGVFVIETLSVILQVTSFRLTGKRLIRCSPLHNHFVLLGEHELKIVVRFWIGSALLAVVAVASLKLR
ncbi:MAG: phospho-N-acetylmuramoyl-pentapeptide-transferase [Planctomycetaceae bacterium]|nr:phospho-N-acetylmuramoyl-pentapeptide-transferase [Planctomycetaceae bacterium]